VGTLAVKRKLLSFVILLSFPLFCLDAQKQTLPSVTVIGRVLDDSTGVRLAQVNVFIANSSLGASSDSDGRFQIKNVPVGTHEIVASLLGYGQGRMRLALFEQSKGTIEFRLRQEPVQLPSVEVTAVNPAEWKKELERFKREFLGHSQNAARCRIINPEVLDFVYDSGRRSLTATGRLPLIFENDALGYRVEYHLSEFGVSDELFRYAGVAKFEELVKQSAKRQEEWKAARESAYRGSLHHFLAALAQGRLEEEGFAVRIVPLFLASKAFTRYAGRAASREEILQAGEFPYEFRMSFAGLLHVLYEHEEVDPGYQSFIEKQAVGPLITSNRQISLLGLNIPSIVLNSAGQLSDPLAVTVYGYWSYERSAEMLPLDYLPGSR